MSSHLLKPVLGGTFDPPHNGHLRCALEVAEWTRAPVVLMPSGAPAHRDSPGATPAQRWQMLQLAVAGHPSLCPDDRELQRSGPTYSVDTFSHWRAEEPDTAFCFIVGRDAFDGLPRWKRWRELTDLTHFLVVTRPGQSADPTGELREWCDTALTDDLSDLRQCPAGRVIFHPVTALDISASAIRRLLGEGRDPAFLVPDAVRNYLLEHRIYSGGME